MSYSTIGLRCERCDSYHVKDISSAHDINRGFIIYECQECCHKTEVFHNLFREDEIDEAEYINE